jgi:hypothetical protein
MLHTPSSLWRPLPVAPRPFEGELLGGWIGRVAGRYRMSVQDFAQANSLDLGLDSGKGWLLLDYLSDDAVAGLMVLMRMSKAEILAVRRPPSWIGPRKAFFYCPRCVFVNSADVTTHLATRVAGSGADLLSGR